jgi:hypothetical protein
VISRQVASLAIAAVLVAGAGVAAATTKDGDGTEEAGPATTSTVEQPVAPAISTTDPPVPTSTSVRPTTTTAPRPTTTARPPVSTTSTTIGDCTAAQIDVTATTDRRSYSAGQQVMVDSTLRNRSESTCLYAGYTFQVVIQDAVGRPIITFEVATPGPARSSLVPGATLTGSVPWDQRSCQAQPCPQPPPGPYVVAVKWTFPGGPYEAKAAFSLAP